MGLLNSRPSRTPNQVIVLASRCTVEKYTGCVGPPCFTILVPVAQVPPRHFSRQTRHPRMPSRLASASSVHHVSAGQPPASPLHQSYSSKSSAYRQQTCDFVDRQVVYFTVMRFDEITSVSYVILGMNEHSLDPSALSLRKGQRQNFARHDRLKLLGCAEANC